MACRAPSIEPHRAVEIGDRRLDLSWVVDVQLEDRAFLGKPLHRALGETEPASEPGDDDLGALLLGDPGRVPGDRVVCQHPGDQEFLAFEQHEPS